MSVCDWRARIEVVKCIIILFSRSDLFMYIVISTATSSLFLFFFPSCKERRGECFPLLWVSLSVFAYVSVESEKVSGEKLSDDEEGEGILSRLKRKLFG